MVIAHRLHPGHFFGGTMKPYQSLGVGPAEPSPVRPHPVSFSRARGALAAAGLLSFPGLSQPRLRRRRRPGPQLYYRPRAIRRGANYPRNPGAGLLLRLPAGLSMATLSSSANSRDGHGRQCPQHNCITRLTNTGALDTTFNNYPNHWRDPQRLHLSP